jgi:type VI secretion system Hcp family effector
MALNLYLELTLNGVAVEGGALTPPAGRENDIECLSFQYSLAATLAAGSTQSAGRRKHKPIVIRKLIDASSPKLTRALTRNEVVTAAFRFFRADAQSGSTEHYFTVEIREARIASVNHLVFDTFRPDVRDLPQIEEVSFVFNTIKWTDEISGVESEDAIRTDF